MVGVAEQRGEDGDGGCLVEDDAEGDRGWLDGREVCGEEGLESTQEPSSAEGGGRLWKLGMTSRALELVTNSEGWPLSGLLDGRGRVRLISNWTTYWMTGERGEGIVDGCLGEK
jgi:hypothetical protein